jgi:hypothetical protein
MFSGFLNVAFGFPEHIGRNCDSLSKKTPPHPGGVRFSAEAVQKSDA